MEGLGVGKNSSFTTLPLLEDISTPPKPYLNPCTALILNIPFPISAWSLSKTGSPQPTGTPKAIAVISPPIVSPSFFVFSISKIIC